MELYIPPKKVNRNPINGRFVKGCIPHNKGKKCEDYMDDDAVSRFKEKARETLNKNRIDSPKRSKAVIGIKDGKSTYFESMVQAGNILGVKPTNISMCCHKKRKSVAGYRFFLFEDDEWTKLIK